MSFTYAVAMAGLALAEQPTPLTASGKWTVNLVEKMCLVERTFGTEDHMTIFAMRPNPLGKTVEIRVSEVEPGYVARFEAGKVVLQPSGKSFSAKMSIFGPITNGRRLTSFYLDDVDVTGFIMAKTITINRGHAGAPLSIAPAGSDEVVAATNRCGDSLLRGWGVDPVAMHSLSRQPAPIGGAERAWFKPRDYPTTARKNFRTGRTVALIAIGADGRV